MAHIISLANQKGGVGKTTTAVNLAASITRRGKRVLIIDLDPQGNATTGLGIEKSNLTKTVYDVLVNDTPLADIIQPIEGYQDFKIAPTTTALAGAELELADLDHRESRLKNAIAPIENNFDYIFIDNPPALGLLTINSFTAANSVLIPVQAEYYALEGLGQLMNTVIRTKESFNPNLNIEGVLITMTSKRTNLSQQVSAEVRKYFGDQVFKTEIVRTIKLSEAPSYGQSIIDYSANSKGSQLYQELADEVLSHYDN